MEKIYDKEDGPTWDGRFKYELVEQIDNKKTPGEIATIATHELIKLARQEPGTKLEIVQVKYKNIDELYLAVTHGWFLGISEGKPGNMFLETQIEGTYGVTASLPIAREIDPRLVYHFDEFMETLNHSQQQELKRLILIEQPISVIDYDTKDVLYQDLDLEHQVDFYEAEFLRRRQEEERRLRKKVERGI